MRTEVATSHLRATPGIPAILEVEVTNTADVIDGVTATIHGLDAAWVSLVTPVVSLFPDSTSTLSLRIDLPRNCLAGEYLVSVHVVSIIDPERFSDHEFWLSVAPLAGASMELHPSVVVGGKQADFGISIVNEGNIPVDLVINTLDETRLLTCVANPATVSIPAGETHTVTMHVTGPRPWFGQALNRNIKVEATGTGLQLEGVATFTQKPRIPRGVLTILILVLIIALWATIFLVVIGLLRDTKDPTKAPATNFNKGGDQQVDLKTIGGAMAGTVTSESTGAPAPLITVQAFRIKPDGSLDSIASTGTGDDGTYTLESLLPGSYKLQFTAQGYAELWYPAAPDSGSATAVKVDPGAALKSLDVVLTGNPGSMTGQIVASDGKGAQATITVTVQQVIDKPKPGETVPAPINATVDGTGTFTLPPLITPATYDVHVESPNFDSADFKETLGAGENKVINTITLGAAPGSVGGLLTDGAGKPLGGADVTIASGDFVKKTKTPTSGNVGQFLLDELKTPATYVITFSLAGYGSSTQSFDLASGENKTISAQILGGTGTISGLVTDTAGKPLDAANVTITHGKVTATTSTLTASAAIAQEGTYSITALPTPAPYTVTISLAGYDTQTIQVLLPSAGSVSGINAILPRTNGIVTGNVTSAGVPTADVIVDLSSGANPRTTTTASSPAGQFSFPDVPPGSYTLTFHKLGLATRVVIITVKGDATITQNADLPVGS